MKTQCSMILAAAATILIAGCHNDYADPANNAPKIDGSAIRFQKANPPVAVKTTEVALERGTKLTMSGRIVWDEDRTVRIFSSFAGRVTRINANLGDRVTAGKPLAMVDSPDYGSAQADYRKAVSARSLAMTNLERSQDLYEHGVISQKELEQEQSDAISADAEAERTERVMKQFADNGESIDQRMILRSPIDGVVVERSINPGQELRVDQAGAPLFVVTNPGFVWLSLDAREDDLAVLKPGQAFTFRIGSNGNDEFVGTVLRVADYVDPNSRTIKIVGKSRNLDHRLKGEMFVTATFAIDSEAEPQVPAAAVYLLGEQHYAFVVEGDAFVRREIRIGAERGGQVLVRDGVKPGEFIVTEGALFLQQMLQSRPQS